jgi:hypothetical protein
LWPLHLPHSLFLHLALLLLLLLYPLLLLLLLPHPLLTGALLLHLALPHLLLFLLGSAPFKLTASGLFSLLADLLLPL